MKPLNSGHLVVLNNLSVIERCQLLGGNIKKIVIFGTQYFVCYSLHVRYWEISLYQKNVGRYERNHWKQEEFYHRKNREICDKKEIAETFNS